MMNNFKEELFEFAERTTCHGIAQISNKNRNFILKILWVFVIIAFACCMILQLNSKIKEYTDFTANTEVNEEFVARIDFPAVTVCNFNRFFNLSSHAELSAIDALLRSTAPSHDRKYDAWWNEKIRDFLDSRNRSKFYLSEEIEMRGWQLNDENIQKCSFKQQPCSAKNFTPVVTPMGMCFKFTPSEKLYQMSPGSTFGLLLTLNIKQDLYSEHPLYGRAEAGVKILVHSIDEEPLVSEYGVAVPSGQTAHVVIKKIERHLMYKPWGVCSSQVPQLKFYGSYTFTGCMRECRLQYIIDSCGCKPYWAPYHTDYVECHAMQIINCSGPMEANFTKSLSVEKCGCVQLCSSTSFNTKVSYATYPSMEVGEMLVQNHASEISDVVIMNHELAAKQDPNFMKLDEYRDNHLQVDIYYDSLSFLKISQSKKVTEVSLLSDIGGILGLWLGISIVTVGEIIQLCLTSLFAAICSNAPIILPKKQLSDEEMKCNVGEGHKTC